jgi:hypothetical protein
MVNKVVLLLVSMEELLLAPNPSFLEYLIFVAGSVGFCLSSEIIG